MAIDLQFSGIRGFDDRVQGHLTELTLDQASVVYIEKQHIPSHKFAVL